MKGKVYVIYSESSGLAYYGSTIQTLEERFSGHESAKRCFEKGTHHYCYSFKVLDCGDAKIELMKEIEYDFDYELKDMEALYIKNYPCVNHNIPNRTMAEWYQDNREAVSKQHKQHYFDNQEAILKQKKQYYSDNQEAISKKNKQHYSDNQEAILKKMKQYYYDNQEARLKQANQYNQNNREEINKKAKEKHTCQCGSIYRRADKSRHLKSNKHQQLLSQQTEVVTAP
jgi:hypothetical protein